MGEILVAGLALMVLIMLAYEIGARDGRRRGRAEVFTDWPEPKEPAE